MENYKINPDGIKPKQDGEDNSLLVQKDYADKYATTTLSIEKITEKLKPIREEVLSYYNQTIRFDKRKSSYQFKSFPKVWRRQTDGINKILSQRESVITIPVGGGKSLITIEALKHLLKKGEKCLILCELNKLDEWARDCQIEEVDHLVDIINHDAITGLFKITTDKRKRKTFTKSTNGKNGNLWKNNYNYIIVDEVTNFKNKSNRGLALKKFIKDKEIEFRVMLTGTPYYTGIKDIWGILANTTEHPLQKITSEEFEFYWHYTKSNNEEDLAIKKKRQNFLKSLFLPSLFCKTFKDYPEDQQPPKYEIILVPLEPTEGFKHKCISIMKNAKTAKFESNGKMSLVDTAVMNMRIEASKWKQGFVSNLIENNPEEKYFIASSYNKDVLDKMEEEYSTTAYTGKTSKNKRKEIIKSFTDGNEVVFLGNLKTTSKGMSVLQNQCKNLIIVSVPHEAGMLEQIIGRLVRPREDNSPLGDEPVKIYFPFIKAFDYMGRKINIEEAKFSILMARAREMMELTGSEIAGQIGEAFDFVDTTTEVVAQIINKM